MTRAASKKRIVPCLALAAVLCTGGPRFITGAQEPPADLFEPWRDAVTRHALGRSDDAARLVAGWTNADLLAALTQIRERKGSNALLTRGAALHLDIYLLLLPAASGPLFPDSSRRAPPSYLSLDGQGRGRGAAPTHLEFAREVLDLVVPSPAENAVVRLWYVATATSLAQQHNFAEGQRHLRRAREIFPLDPEILLASGCLHETFASPGVQSVALSTGGMGRLIDVGSEGGNLRSAERYYRQALERSPGLAEARLRLGRVLTRQGRHNDAMGQLLKAQAAGLDRHAEYVALLFLGREAELLGRTSAARDYFERAVELFPLAQSPHLALSRLAFHDGDVRRAEQAMRRLLALPPDVRDRLDPWWRYDSCQGRHAEALLARLHDAVRAEGE